MTPGAVRSGGAAGRRQREHAGRNSLRPVENAHVGQARRGRGGVVHGGGTGRGDPGHHQVRQGRARTGSAGGIGGGGAQRLGGGRGEKVGPSSHGALDFGRHGYTL